MSTAWRATLPVMATDGHITQKNSVATRFASLVLIAATIAAAGFAAAEKKANPAGKIFFTDVNGDVSVATRSFVQEAARNSLFQADGIVVETETKPRKLGSARNLSTMVYSNGTGVCLTEDTHLKIKTFTQEPFRASQADLDLEPSMSVTDAFIVHGTIALSTSKTVGGTRMIYETRLGTILVRGRTVVIEVDDGETRVTVLEGECTIRAGSSDAGGHTVKAGEQASIRPGEIGRSNILEIAPIRREALPALMALVDVASAARRTVYFQERPATSGLGQQLTTNPRADATATEAVATIGNTDAAAPVFDRAAANAETENTRDIVAFRVVPTVLPDQFTVSPSRIK